MSEPCEWTVWEGCWICMLNLHVLGVTKLVLNKTTLDALHDWTIASRTPSLERFQINGGNATTPASDL